MKHVLNFLTTRPLISLAFLFAASRAVLYPLFPFKTDFLPWLNQLLDINLLRTDLWNSLWQLHATPPLYNLYVGAVVAVFPENMWTVVFTALHFLMGLAMVLTTYRILKYLQVSHWFSFIGALSVALYPILFRFEIIPFYTYPLAFLLVLSVFLLIKLIETKKNAYLIGFLAVPLVILLFRNFFHVIFFYLPIVLGVCVWTYNAERKLFKTALIASLLFLAMGLAPSIKNQLEYGIFSSSTWQGMQFFSMTYFVPNEKIEALVAEGAATPLALLPRFENPDMYYDYYNEVERPGNPVLNAKYKSAGNYEFGNFNNWIYIQTAKEYGENTVAIMSRYPEYFLPRLVNSAYIYFGFANYRYFDKTDEWLIFDGNALKQAFQAGKYFIQPALYALLFAWILWFLSAHLWRAAKEKKLGSGINPVLLYLLFTLLYTFGVATVVELGENYTARVPIDPLIIILATMLIYIQLQARQK